MSGKSMWESDAPWLGRRQALQAGAAAVGAMTLPARAEPGVTDKDIRIGQSTALTGPLSGVAREFTSAAAACFEAVNEKGGVAGRRITLTTRDDSYVPARTAENVKELIENEGVFALFGVLGVPNTAVALPIATEAKVPFLFPMNGDPAVRKTHNRYLFTVTGSFDDEIDRLVAHVTTIGAKRISVAYQTNPFGKSILEAAEKAVVARGLKLHSSAAFDPQGDKTKAARDIAATTPDAVIIGAVAIAAADFMQAFRAAGSAALLLTFSGVGTDIVYKHIGVTSAGLVVSQIVPYPFAATVPIVREYQAVTRARGGNEFSHLGLWGHISARVLVEALRRVGRDLRRERLIDTLERMSNVDIGHFVVDFSPGKHHGSRFAAITLLSRTGRLVM